MSFGVILSCHLGGAGVTVGQAHCVSASDRACKRYLTKQFVCIQTWLRCLAFSDHAHVAASLQSFLPTATQADAIDLLGLRRLSTEEAKEKAK